MSIHVLGIRHHGPGCARCLRLALDELKPDVIVLEGPADAQDALSLAGHSEMKPPVALLVYPADEPRGGVYYPMALFSPEWQALRWAYEHHVPVRLMDLPQSIQFAQQRSAKKQHEEERQSSAEACGVHDERTYQEGETSFPTPHSGLEDEPWRTDPIAVLAQAAGYLDYELWWEEQVERRNDVAGLFAAILEAMSAVRVEIAVTRERDLLREAHMRQSIRALGKDGHSKIAVICGAWHAPVLIEAALAGDVPGCTSREDVARLKGLPKLKTVATWIPWTLSRLTYRSGYGAGVQSPGWYAHVWESHDRAPLHWVACAARLLRSSDLDASSASVIETIRLAEALAALRDIRSPGLAELNEAILSVLCHGEPAPLKLIHDRLEIGDVLGETPKQAQTVPLARDLEQLQKSLRLTPSSEVKTHDLDLRKELDLSRSRLFHRLLILEIPWGELKRTGGKDSTFHELWQLAWKPELAVEVIEANIWGNTVETAAVARALDQAKNSTDLPGLTALLDLVLLAGLSQAMTPLLTRLQNQSAVAADVRQLMNALPALARVARYGDVRGTQATEVLPILERMFERAMVGLIPACSSLDDDAAQQMADSLANVQHALELVQKVPWEEHWHEQLHRLIQKDVHGLVRGWGTRLLLEKAKLDDLEFHRLTRLALSPAGEPAKAAAWATGLMRGSGMALLHQDELWRVFDQWLRELPEATFTAMLPLIRRAFADFTGPERRQMGQKVNHLQEDTTAKLDTKPLEEGFDAQRARLVLPVLAKILGVTWEKDLP